MSSSSDFEVDESLLPPVEECQRRVDTFVTITETNSAVAQQYLQRSGWIVEPAVIAYLEREHNIILTMEQKLTMRTTSAVSPATALGAALLPALMRSVTLLTWNVDGLDQTNLKQRTLSAGKLLVWDKPEIIFLQEVVPETLKVYRAMLADYDVYSDKLNEGYFNVTMVRRPLNAIGYHVEALRNTKMSRNMLCVDVELGNLKLALINVHLESTIAHVTERVAQLKDCFAKMLSYPPDVTVIFAGDMNLRDREVVLAGNIPVGVDDVWVKCGSRKNAEFTFDLKVNTNKQMPCKNQPRCRFDRFYIRYANSKAIHPINFCLAGVEKVPNLTCFISDHWAVRSEMEVAPQVQSPV